MILVLIKNNLRTGGNYGRAGFVYGMSHLMGKVCQIKHIDSDKTYKISGADRYWWTEKMFVTKVITNEKNKC